MQTDELSLIPTDFVRKTIFRKINRYNIAINIYSGHENIQYYLKVLLMLALFELMTSLDRQRRQNVDGIFASVVDFLDHKLKKTSIQLLETPCYFYRGTNSKLEVIVFSNPGIASIDIKLLGLGDAAKEPYFQHSYDLYGLSISVFKREIDDYIFKCNRPR